VQLREHDEVDVGVGLHEAGEVLPVRRGVADGAGVLHHRDLDGTRLP
jgi:hypothetical protein